MEQAAPSAFIHSFEAVSFLLSSYRRLLFFMRIGSRNWGSNLPSRPKADRSQTYFSTTKQTLFASVFLFLEFDSSIFFEVTSFLFDPFVFYSCSYACTFQLCCRFGAERWHTFFITLIKPDTSRHPASAHKITSQYVARVVHSQINTTCPNGYNQ